MAPATKGARRTRPASARDWPVPRVFPAQPRRTDLAAYEYAARSFGIELFPWQVIAADYTMGLKGRGRGWRYPEVAVVVARQNGKTEYLVPRIVDGLFAGERIIHTAQIRTLPRRTFLRVARWLTRYHRAEVAEARYANGQEEIVLVGGGSYSIVAAQRGARGEATDTVIIDEVREFEDFDLIAAIAPTLTASTNPQTIYLSNAGHEASVVLNDLRRRADTDRDLAYLEWSAAPERPIDDEAGWREANPSPLVTLDALRRAYEKLPASVFETEHLCRWVISMAPRLVNEAVWLAAGRPLGAPHAPSMGVSVDPSGARASAALAWTQSDGTIALTLAADVTGAPVDVDKLGRELARIAREVRAGEVAYDPWTDQHIARHFPTARAVTGREWANASERFARLVEGGALSWASADAISADLPYTVRKLHDIGAWHAERADEARPITAALAAIRAVWLAAAPRPPAPRVY
jgi:hypothetical protein